MPHSALPNALPNALPDAIPASTPTRTPHRTRARTPAGAGPAVRPVPGSTLSTSTQSVLSVLATLALAGCSGAVRVDPPTPSGAAATACRQLGAALPARLDGVERVESEPSSPYVAVWGAGEIALRCGVRRPSAMAPTDEVSDVNGVGWFEDPAKPSLYTAVNREAYVEVTISRKHAPGAVLVDLAAPIKATIPE